MMKLTENGLMLLKAASLLLVFGVAGNLSFSPAYLKAADRARETPVIIRLDFIVGGNHAPWFVAWKKGFYAKGTECHHPAGDGFRGHDPRHRFGWG